MSGEMADHLFETYTISVMKHGKHMFQTAYGIAMEKMCAYQSSNYALPHWKCVLRFCAQRTQIYLPKSRIISAQFKCYPRHTI